jgi:hypothetical protein
MAPVVANQGNYWELVWNKNSPLLCHNIAKIFNKIIGGKRASPLTLTNHKVIRYPPCLFEILEILLIKEIIRKYYWLINFPLLRHIIAKIFIK